MEIRNLKILHDGKKLATFDVYVPKYCCTFQGLCLIKTAKSEIISPMSKFEKAEDGINGEWIKSFKIDEEYESEFYRAVKNALKDAMNKYQHPMHD